MADEDWETGFARAVAVVLDGRNLPWPDPRGEPVTDDVFAVLLNAHAEPLDWQLPDGWTPRWRAVLDTALATLPDGEGPTIEPRRLVVVEGRSLQLWQGVPADDAGS
jgi:glycogen operon protein